MVDNWRVDAFTSYSVDADMYAAASAFWFELPGDHRLTPWARCELRINDHVELSGIVERVTRRYAKPGRTTVVEGRDLMGLVVDYHLREFKTLKNTKVVDLTRELVGKIDYVDRWPVEFRNGASTAQTPKELEQLEPGQTVFDVLKRVAAGRGLLFYGRPDGSLVFGRPLGRGASLFGIAVKDGRNHSGVLEAELVADMAERFNPVVVMGQRQGTDELSASAINTIAEAADEGVPFTKPYVQVVDEHDDPTARAFALRDQMLFRGRQIRYTVRGHSQAGRRPWTTDALCSVDDDELGVHEDLLIYGRTFRMSRDEGAVTEVRLAKPGVVF